MSKIEGKNILNMLKKIGKPVLFVLYLALNTVTFHQTDSEKDYEYYRLLTEGSSKLITASNKTAPQVAAA
jgi:hypothetical protein